MWLQTFLILHQDPLGILLFFNTTIPNSQGARGGSFATLVHFSETMLCETVVIITLYCIFVQNPFWRPFGILNTPMSFVDDMNFSCGQKDQLFSK